MRLRDLFRIAAALVLLASAAAAAPEADTVRVIDAATGKPLADTELVISYVGGEGPARAPWSRLGTTDTEGALAIDDAGGATTVRVQTGSRAGSLPLRDGHGTVLPTAPFGTVVALVVDQTGRPRGGVAVALSQWEGARKLPERTNAAGCATWLVPRFERDQKARVEVVAAFRPSPYALINWNAPTPVSVLRMPARTLLAVTVEGLAPGEEAVARFRDAGLTDPAAPYHDVPVVAGRAECDSAPAGTEVLVEVTSSDASRPTARRVVRAPAAEGGRSELTLRVGRAKTIVEGRLVDAAGAPVTDADVWISLRSMALVEVERLHLDPYLHGPTDEHGGFRVECDRDLADLRGGRVMVHATGPARRDAVAWRDVPLSQDDGPVRLGDLPARDALHVVSGRAVGENGSPAAGAPVWVETRRVERWVVVPCAQASCEADGSFEIRAPAGADLHGPLRLRAQTGMGDGLEVRRAFERGRRDLEIRFERGAKVELDARCIRVPALELGARLESPRASWCTGAVATPGTNRLRFVSPDVARGRVDVTWLWRQAPLLAPFEIEIPANGGLLVPERDLDAAFTTSVVTVVDGKGAPVAGAEVRVWQPRQIWRWTSAVTDASGRASFVRADARLHAVATDAAGRVGAAAAPSGDLAITLRPRPTRAVTVHVEPPLAIPAHVQLGFEVTLLWTGPPGTQSSEGCVRLDDGGGIPSGTRCNAAGIARVAVREPGTYLVQVRIAATGPGGGFGEPLPASEAPVLVLVPEDGEPPEAVVTPPAEWVRDQVERAAWQ